LAGLDPTIRVFLGFGDLGGQEVNARNKSGQGALKDVSRLAPLDLRWPNCSTGWPWIKPGHGEKMAAL
jgi:hypothetical protein